MIWYDGYYGCSGRNRKKMMEESMEERRNYTQKGNHNWLQKFMRNKKYSILDNEGSGDCFFAVLKRCF